MSTCTCIYVHVYCMHLHLYVCVWVFVYEMYMYMYLFLLVPPHLFEMGVEYGDGLLARSMSIRIDCKKNCVER